MAVGLENPAAFLLYWGIMRVIIKQHPGTSLWVSSDGRVVLPPCRKYPHYRFTFGSKNVYGYMVVEFRGKKYKVHRLIAETFLDNPLGLPTVDHKNRVKTANFVENLCWADYKMQEGNKQSVDNSLNKYGVRKCENPKAYNAAHYAKHHEEILAQKAAHYTEQKALGKHYRSCPDGKRRMLTDAEFDARFGNNQQMPLF